MSSSHFSLFLRLFSKYIYIQFIIMNKLLTKVHCTFSKYLDTLYKGSIEAQTPFFKIDSSRINILQDPLEFYLYINNSISQSSQRIGLSSLYLGTGPLERHLLNKIKERHKICPSLRSAMVFDYHRSQREEHGDSPYQILTNFSEEVGNKSSLSFQKIGKGKGILGQILGVHHQKIYIFDDVVVLGGANLSKNYFLNRKDRYLTIQSSQLSDYLFEYLQILSEQTSWEEFKVHYKLWKYAHMPDNYHESFQEQLAYLKKIQEERKQEVNRTFNWQTKEKNIVLGKNKQIAEEIGTSITTFDQKQVLKYVQKREEVRDRLFSIDNEDYIGNELEQLGNPHTKPLTPTGEQVYLFPFIQWPKLEQTHENILFKKILQLSSQQKHYLRLSSGYLNIDKDFFTKIAKENTSTPSMELICSAPEANSFYRAGKIKKYIPYMYRCYEHQLLTSSQDKILIKEYFNNRWSFHAKGVWLQQAENSYLTVVGSSNFNMRSKDKDTELQVYIYSGCKDLNERLNKEWEGIAKDCKVITKESIEKDDEIKVSFPFKTLSKIFQSVL